MKCPKCKSELQGNHCAQCGIHIDEKMQLETEIGKISRKIKVLAILECILVPAFIVLVVLSVVSASQQSVHPEKGISPHRSVVYAGGVG